MEVSFTGISPRTVSTTRSDLVETGERHTASIVFHGPSDACVEGAHGEVPFSPQTP